MWLVCCGCTGMYVFCLFDFIQQVCWCYCSAHVVDLCTGILEVIIISERAQSCSCSIEISDTYVYIYIYMWPYVKLYAHAWWYIMWEELSVNHF